MTTQKTFHLLVIDDDQGIIDALKLILPAHWRMTSTSVPLVPSISTTVHAAMVDMHLKGNLKTAEGPGLIKTIFEQNSKIEIIAMSGDLSLDLMETCLKHGASKFLAKPLSAEEVLSNLEKIEALWQIRSLESKGRGHSVHWHGTGKASDEIKRKIASLRGESGPILIEGETGTGKEVVFRLLNAQEPNRPSVTVNIAAIPENLFESELFGHVKGAFTGADSMKVGLTEAAHGGDLFLDEIEALPLTQQVKLLRFLETGEIRKVGAKDSTIVNARVIAATNQNLQQLVKDGKFREDLMFRLSGKKIILPPLRDRKEDIQDLAKHLMSAAKARAKKVFSQDALQALQTYSWPGNVRELKRICEQLNLAAPLPIVRKEDVSSLLHPGSDENSAALNFDGGLTVMIERFEGQIISEALKKMDGDVEEASKLLMMSRSSLYQKMKAHNVQLK